MGDLADLQKAGGSAFFVSFTGAGKSYEILTGFPSFSIPDFIGLEPVI